MRSFLKKAFLKKSNENKNPSYGPSLTWCQCPSQDPSQWLKKARQLEDGASVTVFTWHADGCKESCAIGTFIRSLAPNGVSVLNWFLTIREPSARHMWAVNVDFYTYGPERDCILCNGKLTSQFLPDFNLRQSTLLDDLSKVESTRPGPHNLQHIRAYHVPEWMKTVEVVATNQGGWVSLKLNYASTAEGHLEPRSPGCVDAKYQRVLVPMSKSRAGIGRPMGSRLDPGIIKLWRDTCSKGHEKCRQPKATTPFPERLLLIDVNQWCVVSISPRKEPEYVALSYVWGRVHQPMLSSKTLDEWASPQGLLGITLPATIKDAITVVQSMGIKYLWVDSLCIIHDEQEEEDFHIQQMDRIYSRASLTFAATSGHCKVGLPGVSIPFILPHTLQGTDRLLSGFYDAPPTHQVMGASFTEVFETLTPWLKDSLWRERGWTFQEELCSSTILFFLQNNAVFSCREATWRADVHLENTAKRLENMSNERDFVGEMVRHPNAVSRTESISLFRKLVDQYTLRDLTRPEDVEKAFAGVANLLKDSIGPLYRGIPENMFGEVLGGCWYWDVPLERRVGFPSWSWTGWKRNITWEENKLRPSVTKRVIKDPEIGISPPEKQLDSYLLKIFRFGRDEEPRPLFQSTSEQTLSGPFADHFTPDHAEIAQQYRRLSNRSRPVPDCIAFYSSLSYLSVKPVHPYPGPDQNDYSVYDPATGRALTAITLRGSPLAFQQQRFPFIVVANYAKGLQLMLIEFDDDDKDIAFKENVTSPGKRVSVDDWMGTNPKRKLIIMR
ncbi:hypothetical protein OQA88_1847 [Cercophora sp. LCS_1]